MPSGSAFSNNARASAENRFLPCWITGHTVSFLLSICASLTVLYKFKKRIIQMRQGKNPYSAMLEKTPLTNFSYSSTPALGGMVRAAEQSLATMVVRVLWKHLSLFTVNRLLEEGTKVNLN